MSLPLTGLLHREADGKLKRFPPPRQVPVSPIPQITGIEGKEPLMKLASRLILAVPTALVLAGATMAGAQAVVAPTPAATTETAAPVTQADYDEEGEGWFQWLGHRGHDGHEGHHGGRGEHGDRESHDDDDDDCQPGRGGDDDDHGACGMGMTAQPTTPPANGLFNNGAAPKAQMN